MQYDDTSSIGQASAAVAMANDAIDNARRAAQRSRSKHHTPSSPAVPRTLNTGTSNAEFMKNNDTYSAVTFNNNPNPMMAGATNNNKNNLPLHNASATANMDLKHNDNAYHVIATLITERLLPKVNASPDSTHYTLTAEDTAFFQKMLPYSVRRTFVDALRYRLQLLKSGVGSKDSPLGKLTMQCMMLGLDRANMNVLLELNSSAGTSYPISYKGQGMVAVESPKNGGYIAPTDIGQNSSIAYSPPSGSPQHNNGSNPNNNYAGGSGAAETSAQSLARQQIMAEITETKFLMKGSVTPDAINFWKKHLDELYQRLRALGLEEQLNTATNNDVVVGGGGINDNDNFEMDMYNKQQEQQQYHQQGPHVQSREVEYMENNHLQDGRQMPPGVREYPMQEAEVPMASMPNYKHPEEEPTCDVVAPSDLPGGYMFEAKLGSRKFLATVPPGGVTKGQRFVSTMRELETIEIPVPLGAWRDPGRECCRDGACHPLFLNTMFFPCISLGQIMTRTGLDWHGNPANKLVSSMSCTNMTVLLTFWLAINASAAFMYRVSWERGFDIGSNYHTPLIIFNIFVMIWMITLTKKVRESIRNKYQIPEDKCEGVEDCLCATFCMPCAICQMGRHTADFDTYRATWCTKTGLPRQVELAPVTFYEEDQYQTMNDDGGQII